MGNNTKNKDANIKPYVGAPYNFIPVKETVPYPEEEKLPAHNSVDDELYSGSIAYTVTAKSEISIGGENADGVSRFYKNADGNYAIPGSSMRGLIRSNAQILSGSYVGDDIDDLVFMYREFTDDGPLKKRYKTILGLENDNDKKVRAGYIKNEGGKYVIYGTVNDEVLNKGGMNYFVLSERYINEHLSSFAYLYTKEFGHALQYKKGTVFEAYGNNNNRLYPDRYPEDRKYIKHWKPQNNDCNDCKNKKNYNPFYSPISYKQNEKGRVCGITSPEDQGTKLKGFLCGTGYMSEKKVLYVIPEIRENEPLFDIPERDVRAYKTDLNKKKSILNGKGAGTYEDYTLPEPGETRPVFYIEYGGRIYFGYTPRLRIFYDHTVKDGLGQKKEKFDYVRAIFGYADEDDARRGRVSFEDAVAAGKVIKSKDAVADGQVCEPNVRAYVLSDPKPTSYFDYLIQGKKKVSTYNDNDFGIRGVKQYWIKEEIDEEDPKKQGGESASKFETLPEDTVFKGTVHFRNLRKDELGLLLWSLSLEEESLQNIGKGKPYGFGVIDIKTDSVKRFDKKKAYCSRKLCLDPTSDITGQAAEIIASFKAKNRTAADSIEAFMTMKNYRLKNEKVRYMQLEEYEDRNLAPLPSPQKVVTDAEGGEVSVSGEPDQQSRRQDTPDPQSSSPKVPVSTPRGFLCGTVKEISKESRCGVLSADGSGEELGFKRNNKECKSIKEFDNLKKGDKVMFKKDETGNLSRVQKLKEKYLD